MIKAFKKFSAIALFIIVSCSKTIEKGEFLGLNIGESKDQVLLSLKRNEYVTHVKPDIRKAIEIKGYVGNIELLLDKLLDEPGIVIESRNPKLYIKVSLIKGVAKNVYLAPVNNGKDLGIRAGLSRQSIKNVLIERLEAGGVDHVFNYMPDSKWIDIDNISRAQYAHLSSHDTWVFGETNKHSVVKLYFSGDRLERIKYDWTPIELP